jgi:hypothetical protein
MVERAWGARHRALLAKEQAKIPSPPDPVRESHAYIAWVRTYAQTPDQWSEEFKRLMGELPTLPRLKFRRARDQEVWSWISWLLACQMWGMPINLRTCKLGANPANENARPSETLEYLTTTVANRYPNVTARRLFDAIRHWRKSVSTISK